MQKQSFTTELGGRTLSVEVGKLAGKANGSCTVQYGDTVVLATAVMGDTAREGVDYFPLLVDYEERLYAAGKIKGSRFIKREGRPTDEAILTSRLVDRSIRPLFNGELRFDVQVVLTVLSVDQENDPDVLSLIAASIAVAISDIPWDGPIAGVRVGRVDGQWKLNPTYAELEKSDTEVFVAGSGEKVIMIESNARETAEDDVLAAIAFTTSHLGQVTTFIRDIITQVGHPKRDVAAFLGDQEAAAALKEKVRAAIMPQLPTVYESADRIQQDERLAAATAALDQQLKDDNAVSKEDRTRGLTLVDSIVKEFLRSRILDEGKRPDGRAIDEIRPLSAEVSLLPRTHGSGLFNRGETQVLSVVTLGAPGDEQFLDTMELSGKKRYMHHYNFPAFSVGEVAPLRGPGRREIGHGALAEKALVPVLPPKESFPYTIRVVSEVLTSNGSTSQASICGSSLALMDAGVPIARPVAGIAMGLIADEAAGKYVVLTDIQGAEDFAGAMDFKVAGTRTGITAIQMDTKLHGIPMSVVEEAIRGAKTARERILDVMEAALPAPRTDLSKYAPRIETLKINPDKIRDVIGPGGKIINEIIEKTGVQIDIEDDGTVMVTSDNAEGMQKALDWIRNITHEVSVGEEYTGTVTQIVRSMSGGDVGAIAEFLPGHDGMVHISELSNYRIEKISDVLNIGDTIRVKVISVDKERGRVGLSHKEIDGEDLKPPHPVEGSSGPRDGFRGGSPHRGRDDRPHGRGGFSRRPRY
ncbi:MAG: polyribonucleotide nucleotidyltransferase [Candidatus Kerfeldbacteria bacterium]|nr:polyribonucleotide nucleotidyltransferase [Candidatus Kerfeldbacteria bacterium]